MKKIFRMAMVCALAGATLLYTGCTKDYSEDISNLESRLNTLEGTTIKSLQDQVKELENARKALEDAKQKAETAIETLQGKVATLEGKVADLEPKVNANTSDIATLKNDVANLKKRVSDLEAAKTQIEDAIKKINEDLAKKADKSYVDEELGKKADLQYVKDTYATIAYVNEQIGALQGTLSAIQGEITNIKGDLSTLKSDMAQAKSDISALQTDMSKAKTDIINAKNAADAAQKDASKALSDIAEIQEALKAIYTKAEVDAIVKSLDSTINVRISNLEGRVSANEESIKGLDSTVASHKELIATLNNEMADAKKAIDTLKDTKLDIAAYKADTAVLGAKIRSIDATIAKVIEDYQNADANLQNQIDTLKDQVEDLYETKLDKTTFEQFKDELESRLDALSASIGVLLSRVQSLVYVPDYADGKIRFPYALLADAEGNTPDMRQGSFGQTDPEGAIKCEAVIEKTTNVKFRVYGEDAAELALAIAEAKDSLAFDVVSVRPNVRGNEAGAAVDIVDVKASTDEFDGEGVIILTVLPNSLGDAFYLIGNESWSMSLVLTSESRNALIQSCYVNAVPAPRAEIVCPGIYKQDEEGEYVKDGKNYVCMNNQMDTIEVEYTNTEAQAILPSIELLFAKGDTLLTYDEIVAAGYAIPEPADTLYNEKSDKPYAFTDLYGAIDASKLPDPYFVADTLSYEYLPAAGAAVVPGTIALAEVNKGGVGAKKYDLVEFTIGSCKVAAAQLEIVTPVKVEVNAHIWESAEVDPFTWNYSMDAQNDSIALANDATVVSGRDSAIVKIPASEIEKLKNLDIELSDFDHKAAAEWAVLCGADTCENIEVYPYFVDGELYVSVNGFEWDKEYELVAVYNLPTDDQPAIEVTVKAGFETVDRNREDIVITLPTSVEKWAVDYKDTVDNVLADAISVDAPIYLSNEDLFDAFGAHKVAHSDTIGITLDKTPMEFFDGSLETTKALLDTSATGVLKASAIFDSNEESFTEREIGDTVSYVCENVLWYGQRIIVLKEIVFDTDNIFDYERINEYVEYMNLLDCSTTVQPLWSPDAASIDMTLPLEAYDARKVNLDQHFRIREIATDEVATNLDGTIKEDYSYLLRKFTLEDPNGTPVESILDPRNIDSTFIEPAKGITMSGDTLSYYSMTESVDVYGSLAIVNTTNGAYKNLKTRFDRESTLKPVEGYENYVVKKYEPLKELEVIAGEGIEGDGTEAAPFRINVNNSIKTETSIYKFLSLKDKRGWETIDPENNGWVIGDGENGFAEGISVVDLYGLQFTHDMEYITEVSPETQSRIEFDTESGLLTYNNVLQTQLAQPITLALTVQIDYVWGQRGYGKPIYVQFYNKPVGE